MWILWMLACGMDQTDPTELAALEERVQALEAEVKAMKEQSAGLGPGAGLQQRRAEAMARRAALEDGDAEERRQQRLERLEHLREMRERRKGELQGDDPGATTLREALSGDADEWATMGRALLHRGSDGSYDGYRLSAIRSHSAAAELGFRNDDVVTSVAGVSTNSMESAMEAYRTLLDSPSDTIEVVLLRGDETVTLQLPLDEPL